MPGLLTRARARAGISCTTLPWRVYGPAETRPARPTPTMTAGRRRLTRLAWTHYTHTAYQGRTLVLNSNPAPRFPMGPERNRPMGSAAQRCRWTVTSISTPKEPLDMKAGPGVGWATGGGPVAAVGPCVRGPGERGPWTAHRLAAGAGPLATTFPERTSTTGRTRGRGNGAVALSGRATAAWWTGPGGGASTAPPVSWASVAGPT